VRLTGDDGTPSRFPLPAHSTLRAQSPGPAFLAHLANRDPFASQLEKIKARVQVDWVMNCRNQIVHKADVDPVDAADMSIHS